jgi:cysteinyl-tRNA synthetase
MDDDFNTPEALAVLFDLAGEVNRNGDAVTAGLLKVLGGVLGLLQRDPKTFLRAKPGSDVTVQLTGVTVVAEVGILTPRLELDDTRIEALIQQRLDARKTRDFKLADAIREELNDAGILLEDRPDGTTDWRRG